MMLPNKGSCNTFQITHSIHRSLRVVAGTGGKQFNERIDKQSIFIVEKYFTMIQWIWKIQGIYNWIQNN